ncbi:MAG: ABC transporter transmembrane domain-containing protein, partial [Heliobacteriaceae bacterium]|nr:ABC transporter transmembrane domain-containing protein [Heliobacteriaceae bacterium]
MDLINGLKYRRIEAAGNRPVILDANKVWLVQAGKVDIFVTKTMNGDPVGSRRYLFSGEKGDVLLGTAPVAGEDGRFGLLAVGHTGTWVLEIDWPELLGITVTEHKAKLTGWLKKWTEKWAGVEDKAAHQVDWEADFQSVLDAVAGYNQSVFTSALAMLKSEKEAEVLRNKLKVKKDQSFMSSGLHRLIDAMNPKRRTDLDSEEIFIDNLLFKACAAVGKAKRIKIVPSSRLKKNESAPADLLGDIARASQIRIREVILKDEWWKEDNGALLAYKEKDGQPVALLPVTPKKYVLFDPADETKVVVDRKAADTIKARAYTFYRPLPAKVVGYKELLIFLADGVWQRDIIAVFMMGILGGLLGALTPAVTGIIFDSVIPDGESMLLIQIGFLLIAIAVATFAFNLTRAFAMHRIEGRTEADLQAAVWDRLLSLPVPFFKDYTAGELAGRAMGISQIRTVLSGAAANTVISGIFSVFYFFLLFYYSWKLAFISMVIVLVVMTVSLLFGYFQIRYERQIVDLNNNLSGKVFGLLSGVSKIKTSGAETRAFYNWARQFSKIRDITYRKENLGNKLAVFNSTVNIIATGVIFYALLKIKGIDLPAGKFIAFNAAFSKFLASMLEICNLFLQLNIIKPLYERTKPIFETLPEFDQEKADPGELAGNIELSHVNFCYRKDGPLILDDVTIEIKQGDYVGIVGPSGSGKSTLLRLLLG